MIQSPNNNPGPRRPSVLVVDDSPIGIGVLAGALQSECRIRVAASGPAALEIVFSPDPPDLVLVDVAMPDMDGFEVCRRIKDDPRSADIPVIFVTGRDMPTDEAYGLSLGAVDYVHKPLNPPLLRVRVRNHLRLKALTETVARLATNDDLTGLANRRVFEIDFDREWSRARRLRQPIGLAILDLDHFKVLNDIYGLPKGDAVLRWLARIVDEHLRRPTDGGYRWGGGSIGMLMPDTTPEGTHFVIERVRERFVTSALPPDVPDRRLTLSAGIGNVIPDGSMTGGELVRRTERALLEAKDGGRNRTCMWAPALTHPL